MPSIHYFQKSESVKNSFSVKSVAFGTIFSVVVCIILILAASALFLYCGISQRFIPIVSRVIMFVSVLLGGIIAGVKSRGMGWLYGFCSGLLFFCLVLLLNLLMGLGTDSPVFILLILIACVFVGSIGGVIGINLKPRRKH